MSGFLANLAARHLGSAEVVRPRVRALFEPRVEDGSGLRGPSTGAMREARAVTADEGHGDARRFGGDASDVGAGRVDFSRGRGLGRRGSAFGNGGLRAARERDGVRASGSGRGVLKQEEGLRADRKMGFAAAAGLRDGVQKLGLSARAESQAEGSERPAAQPALVPKLAVRDTSERDSQGGSDVRGTASSFGSFDLRARAGASAEAGSAWAVSAGSEPSVRVTIGSVEVRAVYPEAPVRRVVSARQRPLVSLKDFLGARDRGGRAGGAR